MKLKCDKAFLQAISTIMAQHNLPNCIYSIITRLFTLIFNDLMKCFINRTLNNSKIFFQNNWKNNLINLCMLGLWV